MANRDVMTGALTSVLGLVGLAIGYVTFPIVIDSAENVRMATNLTNYTGIASMNGIGPLIIYVTWLFGSLAAVGFGGFKMTKASRK